MREELRTRSVQDSIVENESNGSVQVVVYEPGNGTRYKLVMSSMSPYMRTSPWSDWERILSYLAVSTHTTLVHLHNYNRSFTVESEDFIHYNGVQKNLGCSVFDAVVIAELVGTLLGCKFISVEEFLSERKTG